MKSRRLLNLSSLAIGIAFALSAAASQFGMSSRVTLGPSLNKDIPSTAPPGSAASSTAVASQSTQSSAAQPAVVIVQPERPPNAMERAGQLVRSVLRKIDPKTPVVAPADSVDLNRSRSSTGMSVNTTASVSVPPNSTLTAASDTGSSVAGAAGGATQRPAQSTALNTAMNKQEKNVATADPAKEPRQLQRGILNEQKMNVGTNQ